MKKIKLTKEHKKKEKKKEMSVDAKLDHIISLLEGGVKNG